MITTFEKAIQKSTTRARLSVHHTSFLWAFCQEEFVRSTIHRPVVFRGAGLPFSEISASKTTWLGIRGRWEPSGWSTSLWGSRAGNCRQMGSYECMVGARARHPPSSGSLKNSPDDGASVPALTPARVPYWRKL